MSESVVMYKESTIRANLTAAGVNATVINQIVAAGLPRQNGNIAQFDITTDLGDIKPINTGGTDIYILRTNSNDDAPTFELHLDWNGTAITRSVMGKIPPRND